MTTPTGNTIPWFKGEMVIPYNERQEAYVQLKQEQLKHIKGRVWTSRATAHCTDLVDSMARRAQVVANTAIKEMMEGTADPF